MDKKKFKFSRLFCIVAVLCLATLFSAIFVMQNSSFNLAEQVSQETPITNDYIIDESLVLNSSINQNATASLAEANSTDGISKYCLRDDYVIYTQDQDRNGLCWAFAGNMCVATTLMKATGQYYDFSETWIALACAKEDSSYVYGEGGNDLMFNTIVSKYGLVLESDLQYENSYIICDQNMGEYFNHFLQYASVDIAKNLNAELYYNKFLTSSITTATITKVKEHLYNYGSLGISAYWNSSVGSSGIASSSNLDYFYKCPNSKSPEDDGAHEISIVGWDDDVSITYGGSTHKGAWLCLNSWSDSSYIGKDGIIYVAYDDADVFNIAGYSYKQSTTGLSFENSATSVLVNNVEYSYSTDLKGKYYTGYTGTTNTTQQKNVVFCDNDINSFKLFYDFSLEDKTYALDAQLEDILVYKGDEEVSKDFMVSSNYSLTEKTGSFSLETNKSLTPGTYKILVNYSNSDSSLKGTYIDAFYIMDGNEIAKTTCYVSSESNITNNGQYQIYNSYNYDSNTINLATTKKSGTVYLSYTPATYSKSTTVTTNLSFSGLDSTNTTKQLIKNNVTINVFYVEDAINNTLVNFYYDTDGGIISNKSRMVVNKTNGIVLEIPTKVGYDFAGWYYDKAGTSSVNTNSNDEYVFEYSKIIVLNNDTDVSGQTYKTPNLYAQYYYHSYLDGSCMAFVYAKWTEAVPEITINLTSTNLEPVAGESFTLSVASEPEEAILQSHLADVSVTINWYKGSELLTTTNNSNASSGDFTFMQFEQTISEIGEVVYYVQVIFEQGSLTNSLNSNSITISVQAPPVDPPTQVDSVVFNNGNFSWNKIDEASGYLVIVYCRTDGGTLSNENIIDDSSITSYELDVSSITKAGAYYIGVKSYKLDALNNKVYAAETYSQEINFYEISYITFTQNMESLILQEGASLNNSEPAVKIGYTFKRWCTDENRQLAFEEGSAVIESLTLYADWTMNNISNINAVADIEKEYDKQNESITVSPVHESGLTNFSYVWYKQNQQGQPVVLDGETNSSVPVLNVADSGTYFCRVTLTDSDGFSVTNRTNDIVVTITKAPISIDASGVVTEYTFNAREQTISSGAKLVDKNNEDVSGIDLEYIIEDTEYRHTQNSFVNVPLTGEFTLTIKTLGNDNYQPAQQQVQITVHKADSAIIVEKQYQFFRYNGQPIVPEYIIANSEQTVVPDTQPINKGEYDVTLTALESQNYKQTSTNVHITVNPANIYIKANDIMGVLFAKQQKLTYTIIEGEVYGNDDLDIELHSDVNTGKLGNYSISITSNNENYKIAIFEGNYRITAWPYYAGFFIILFLGWLIISSLNKRRYQYEFETNGGDIVSPIDTKNKGAITLDEPHKEGYRFVGWYTDMELTKPFKNKFRRSKGKTLYAKWEKINGTMSLSEELQSAQEIVDEIQAKINPKKEQKQEMQETPVEEKPKEKTEKEKMQEIVDSVKTKQSKEYSKEELEQFIKRITDKE